MKKIPILLFSDAPDQPTGLSRITKDLAVLSCQIPEVRIATLGMGGRGTAQLPFPQYTFPLEQRWGESLIEEVWEDFAGAENGVIWTIWDASRLTWFSNPQMGGRLEHFLRSGRFKRWGYFPVDSHGVNRRITGQCAETVASYDRVLAYTIYGANVLQESIGRPVDWIPHGYNDRSFQPREKTPGRMTLGVHENDVLIGMVATNQARKDWGVAFETVAILKGQVPRLKFWVHTDTLNRYWNIQALIHDFDLQHIVKVTFAGQFSSEELSYLYSACDLTFLISHEGFGYPLVESMACGVPAIHTTYGGGAELIPDRLWLVPEMTVRLDTQWNIYRPVFTPSQWVSAIGVALDQAQDGSQKDVCTNAVSHLMWRNLWPATFKKWIMAGLK